MVLKYFDNLVGKSAKQRAIVEGADLDAHPPGATHSTLN